MTTITGVHPDAVLKALIEKGGRSDKIAKLRKIHELCSLEYSRHSQGARDLSLSNMSKVAVSHGVFKAARTIYNTQSADYRALMESWEAYNGPKASAVVKQQAEPTEKYAFLRKIEDPAVRHLCHMAFIRQDKLLAELNLLKSKVEVIVDMRPLGGKISAGGGNVAIIEPGAQLTDSERNALVAAIDSKFLAKWRWRLGETGEVLDEKGRFVFMPGFATGIAKILGKANLSSHVGIKRKS